jgi:cation diffusion facilitator CzcD-associated flavoprotein CzcO
VELRRYMKHCDKVLNLSKDTYFNAHVVEARRDEAENVWVVKTQQGHVARAKYLFLGTGLLHRTYVPDFPGASEFKGELHHTAAWPENFDARGKKIAVIGAGATGVQVVQELGREAEELTLFLRRPSYCLPMCQRSCTPEEQHQAKVYYPTLFAAGRNSAVGFPATVPVNGVFDETEEEREERLERMWTSGGFHFLTSTYRDTILNPDSNRVIYDFWRKKVCERLTDPEKNRLMAPETAPYYFGTKRTPLEQDYYEVLNRPHVRIHDLNTSPLEHFSPKGIVTADGTEHDFDTM